MGKYCGTPQNVLEALRLLKAELKPYSYCVSWLWIPLVTLVACERKQSRGIDCTAALSSLSLTLGPCATLCSLLPSPQPCQPLLCLSTAAAGTASGLWVPPVLQHHLGPSAHHAPLGGLLGEEWSAGNREDLTHRSSDGCF